MYWRISSSERFWFGIGTLLYFFNSSFAAGDRMAGKALRLEIELALHFLGAGGIRRRRQVVVLGRRLLGLHARLDQADRALRRVREVVVDHDVGASCGIMNSTMALFEEPRKTVCMPRSWLSGLPSIQTRSKMVPTT